MHAYLYFACTALDGTRWPAALSPIDWPNGDPLFLINKLLVVLLLVIVAGGLMEHVAQRRRKAGALTRVSWTTGGNRARRRSKGDVGSTPVSTDTTIRPEDIAA